MNVKPRRPLFHYRRRSNLYRMFLWACLILAGIWFISQVERGAIKPPFLPTPTPTRTVQSYAMEGDAFFEAGYLGAAITAYQEAVRVDPTNAEVWAKLARIQTYSSSLMTTDEQRKARLEEARYSIDQAVAVAPDDSTVHAIRAFVLDWNAALPTLADDESQKLLTEAEQEAVRALQLDNQNVLALAFYAEILVDQQKWTQAEQYIRQAAERDPTLMDVHRVYAYVWESLGQYGKAIEEYQKAIEINPNLSFLYISLGVNYRQLRNYDLALEYFTKAARLNDQLEIKDPIPYIAIARTYAQQGEFFIAAHNAQKALEIDPANADIFGQLGIIYFKSRNYEGSIPVLRCAVRGCTAQESCEARFGRDCDPDFGEVGIDVEGLSLSSNTVVYYYTYGSVLAALSRPQQNYCPEALEVLGEVRAAYPNDPTVISIVQAGEQICYSLLESLSQTPTPYPTPTPVPTPVP